MFGSRMAMEKLQAMDQGYAEAVSNLIRGRQGGNVAIANNPVIAGMAAPIDGIQKVRQAINTAPMSEEQRGKDLRMTLGMEVGAASRYAVPAAGMGLAGAGIASMAQGSEYEPDARGFTPDGPGYEKINGYWINYETPAHGSTLAPESHAIYKEIHRGLMEGTVSSEELRAAVTSGQFDHDQQLKYHFMDVMG